eukprot:2675863-Amphidinium_carterae.1
MYEADDDDDDDDDDDSHHRGTLGVIACAHKFYLDRKYVAGSLPVYATQIGCIRAMSLLPGP